MAAEQRKGKKGDKVDAPQDKEDKVKPTLADINSQKNKASLVNYLLPAVLMIYLGLVLSKYNLKEFNHLITNKYLLLGKPKLTRRGGSSRLLSLGRLVAID